MSVLSVLTLAVCSVLLVASEAGTSNDVGLVKGPSRMLQSAYSETEEEEARYNGVEKEEEEDQMRITKRDDRLYSGAAIVTGVSTATFYTAMSSAGASSVGVTAAVSTSTLGAAGGSVAAVLLSNPVGVAIAAVGVTVTIMGLSWDWDGIAWPWAKWKNPMELDLADENKAWVWTEEWTGRVFCYEFPNRLSAIADGMDDWSVTRILITWNRDKLVPEVEDERGMAWARQTIKDVANGAYVQQFRKNVESAIGKTITKADFDKYIKNSCSVNVLSIDHESGVEGKYFNFDKAELDAILGRDDWSNERLEVSNGKKVVVWRNSNGGSKGDAHGRWDKNPKAGQFWIGQKVFFC